VSDRLTWPDGTIYTITRSTRDTDGALLEMEWQLPARGWSPQPHVHPHLTEHYTVLDGELELLINRSWRHLRLEYRRPREPPELAVDPVHRHSAAAGQRRPPPHQSRIRAGSAGAVQKDRSVPSSHPHERSMVREGVSN